MKKNQKNIKDKKKKDKEEKKKRKLYKMVDKGLIMNAHGSNIIFDDQDDKNKELRLTESYKSLIMKWLKSSSLHGLPKVMDSRRIFFKIMWMLIFICSTTYMVWSVLRLNKDYHEYPS